MRHLRSVLLPCLLVLAPAALVLAPKAAQAEPVRRVDLGGFFVGVGGGANVATPFAQLEVGRRLSRAPWMDVYLDYGYAAAISEFPFHSLGIGVRSRFARWGRISLHHQAEAALAVSSGGSAGVPDRDLGQRLLGGMLSQGVGLRVDFGPRWSVSAGVSTGTPVWLRSDLTVAVRL